jgi:hypothetical protein
VNETASRLTLWRSHSAIKVAMQNDLAVEHSELGRLFRKGMTVAAFNALEGFILERWEELTLSLELNREKALTFSNLPKQSKEDILKHHMGLIISNVPRFDDRLKEFIATSEVLDPHTNTLFPKSTFMPQGSNISDDTLSTSFALCGIKDPWKQMNSALVFAFPNVSDAQAKKRFYSFLKLRNECAHDPNAFADRNVFRTVPMKLLSLSFSFDILISLFGKFLLDAKEVSDLDGSRTGKLISSASWVRVDMHPSSRWIEVYLLSSSDKTPNSTNKVDSFQFDEIETNKEFDIDNLYKANPDLLRKFIVIGQDKGASYLTLFNADSSELIGWSSLFV